MKTLLTLLLTCAIFAVTSTSALAGGDGGGAKDDGTIVIKNGEDGYVLLVVVGNPPSSKLSDLLKAGAQIVQPQATASFDVAAGDHKVSAILVNDLDYKTLDMAQKTVTVGKNQTTNLTATAVGGATTLN